MGNKKKTKTNENGNEEPDLGDWEQDEVYELLDNLNDLSIGIGTSPDELSLG